MIYSLDDVENNTEVIVRFVNWGGWISFDQIIGNHSFLLCLSETVTTGAKVNITKSQKQILAAKCILLSDNFYVFKAIIRKIVYLNI